MSINITGLDKVTLLRKLWENSNTAIFYTMSGMTPPSFNEGKAETAILNYIDYFCGRCIKCDLMGDTVNPDLYDRDYGAGAVERIVTELRKSS